MGDHSTAPSVIAKLLGAGQGTAKAAMHWSCVELRQHAFSRTILVQAQVSLVDVILTSAKHHIDGARRVHQQSCLCVAKQCLKVSERTNTG